MGRRMNLTAQMDPPETYAEQTFEATHRRRRRWRVVLRVGALLGLAVICLVFEQVGPNRTWVAGVLILLSAVPVILPRLVQPRRWALAQSIFDVGATVALSGFLPDVWAACLIIVVSSPLASLGSLSRRAYVILEAAGLTGLGLAAAATSVAGWEVPLVVAALMVPLAVSYGDIVQVQRWEAEDHLDEVARSSSAVLWEIDPRTGKFIAVSGNVEEVFGWPPDDFPDRLSDLIFPEDRGRLQGLILDSSHDQFVIECRCLRADGNVSWVRIHGHRTSFAGAGYIRGLAIDTTALNEAQEQLRIRAGTDALTGLPNRSELLVDLTGRCEREEKFAVIVIDLDEFKMVNDALGHDAGDRLLAEVAHRLRIDSPATSSVARLAGDEFCVVVELDEIEGVAALTEPLVALTDLAVRLDEIELVATASIGVAVAPAHGTTPVELLRRADTAMYRAKKSESRVEIFTFEMEQSRVGRLEISNQVEEALESGDLRLWFQPKIDLGTKQTTGAEGLLRWHHPLHGPMSPAQFLDVVELSRHRQALCREVIHQGAAFVAQSRERGLDLSAAVNITLRDLVDPKLTELVQHALDRYAIPPDQLVLEITERDLMDDRTGFERAAQAVRELGVGLSIDDFGTGQSSLLRLHSLPVTELKIDRSFISGLGVDQQAGIIVRSVIDLGASLGHNVVAEGIETASQFAQLRAMRCTHGQGFLFSPAVPPEKLLQNVHLDVASATDED